MVILKMDSKVFTIKLADVNIEIRPMHNYIQQYCKDYIIEDTPDFTVETCQADIDFEKQKSKEEDIREGNPVREFPDAYLETLAVYRKIAEKLLDYQVLLVHSSCVAVDGEAYLFTAKSGTGKSTHTRLWRERFGDRAVMVNDDKPLLKVTEQGVIAYGTPWDGKHRLSTNTAAHLKAICVLERGKDNRIEPVGAGSIFPFLLQQTYRPGEPEKMLQTIHLLETVMKKVNLYYLKCNMEPEAAIVSYGGMNGGEKSET